MSMAKIRLMAPLVLLLAISLACRMFAAGEPEPSPGLETLLETPASDPVAPGDGETQPTLPVDEPEDGAQTFDTEFPLPGDVQNFTLMPQSEGGINFQTDMSLDEVVAFYRGEFVSQGLVERELLTVVEDSAFSMVFDGAPNGKAIVIQGVTLGPDQTNVNIRYEDV
jgi:hypothetical protein